MRAALLAIVALAFALPARAADVIVPDAPVMALDEIGLYDVGYAYRGQKERRFPPGWSGDFEDATGVACRPAGRQNGKEAFLLHCPWRGGTGISFQVFTFRVPQCRRVLLRGATAMRSDIVGKSDGATFRIFANGRKLLDVNRTDAAWRPFQFDLTSSAGKTLVLRFETDPGPKDNPSFDFSLWGDRQLVLEGYQPKAASHPAPPPLDLRRLWSAQTGSAAPPSGFDGRTQVLPGQDGVVLRYEGADGALEYRWQAPQGPQDGLFGRVSLTAMGRGDASYIVPLAGGARLEWTGTAAPSAARLERTPEGATLTRTFDVGGRRATLRVAGRLAGKSLVLEITCDQPVVSAIQGGGWGPVVRRRQVTVPYYSGQVYYLPAQNLFVNTFLDWTASSASSQEGTKASYGALTDGSRIPLRERVIYAPAWHMAEVLPNIPNPPSPHLSRIGGRVVLDIWGGRFVDIARGLERLRDNGVSDCIALIHDWQRSGYDNALPMHVPAQAGLGGDEGMRTLVQTGTRLGYLMALHENYVDYYPNYDFFDPNDISLNSAGQRELAWYNPGTKIQSFAEKPNAILRLAATQSPEIHKRYGTNADYLDVHSAVPPWFHVDFRAGEAGAATFARVWEVHRDLWAYERKTHDGPVFGEGNNHWYWSGLLDGVEAQFGSGWPGGQGLSAPLAVDFDLLKIHPLQLNHGMGYYERWWDAAPWGHLAPMVVLDQYRMQEVAYGHAGFLAGSTWNVLPLAWLEHHLMSPVMERYATARPVSIRYEVKGRLVDGTEAAKADDFRRPVITYDNGLTVAANSAAEPMRYGGQILPQFGWSAKGAGVTAGTWQRGGLWSDYAETQVSVFANARSLLDWSMSGVTHIRPTVARFTQTGPRTFQVVYTWQVHDRVPGDYHAFVHFVQAGGEPEGIRFQQDHSLPSPTSSWEPGRDVTDGPYTITIPADVADGDYPWTIGLYSVGGGARLSLEGKGDGAGRVVLGTLRIRSAGTALEFVPTKDNGDASLAWYGRDLNAPGQVVDFGTVRTDGSVLARRQGDEWVLQALPRDRAFALELAAARFGTPAEVRCTGGPAASVKPQPRGAYWVLPLNGSAEYRWKP